MKSIISDIFGSYDPIITTLTDGSEVVHIDYPYIFGVLMFGLVTYCVFRIIGSFGGR